MSRRGRKPGSKGVTTAQLRMQVVPYVQMGWGASRIAPLFGKSKSTIDRWIAHPEVQAALDDVQAAVVASTADKAASLADEAWDALRRLLHGEDERTVLEAAKTILDRKGHPAVTKAEASHDVRGAAVQVVLDEARARELAKGE